MAKMQMIRFGESLPRYAHRLYKGMSEDEKRALRYSLPIVGQSMQSYDYAKEVARFNRDLMMHTGRTVRYPMMQGKSNAVALAQLHRANINAVKKTVNSVMSLW